MNYLKQAPTFLLAFVFIVFGANYFFNFLPMPETTGNVKAFFDLFYPTKYLLVIKTLEGQHLASVGDWIIKDVKGEFYPIKPDIFEATYDKV